MSPPGDSDRRNAGRRRRWIWGGKLLLTLALLGVIVREVAPARFLPLLLSADPTLVLLGVGLTGALNLVKPVRWQQLVRGACADFTYARALRSLLVAASARLVLPGKVGEYGRLLALPGIPVGTGLGLTTLDLLIEVQVALLLSLPAAWWLGGAVAALVPGILLVLAVLATHVPPSLLSRLRLPGRPRWIEDRALELRGAREALRGNVWLRALAITFLLAGIRLAQLHLLLVSLGEAPGLLTVLAVPLVQTADAIPLTVAGVGIREWVGLRLLPATGISGEAAVAAVALQSLISGLLPGVAGVPFLLTGSRGRTEPEARARDEVCAPL